LTATVRPLVVLFDIDETLIHSGGAGTRSWSAAFQAIYGLPADIGQHSGAGETDPQVARATFKAVIGHEPSDDELSHIYARYLDHLADDILTSPEYKVLPGAVATLGALNQAGVLLGLVSGAMEGAARTKLVPPSLNRYFVFGGYGSDSPDRIELTKAAIHKATLLHHGLSADQVFVVGDTPHDIDAAKGAGAVSVGVASGHFSVDELRAAGAHHVLASLEESFPGLS
jgi:phosphoglycolate phosphatase